MLSITFQIDDESFELDIQQAMVDAKVGGISPDEYIAGLARAGLEQLRGTRKRNVVSTVQRLIELINITDPEQEQWVMGILAEIEAKLEELQPKDLKK